MGKHFLLNLYDCSSILLDDELFLIDLIKRAAVISGATVLKTISHKFNPQGVTCICLLSESHISIHTYPELRSCYADIYTCGSANPKNGCDLIIEELVPQRYTFKSIDR